MTNLSTTPALSTAATTGISTDTSRLKSKENLDKAGKQFEAVFTGMMLKSMRAAKLSDPLFDSKALDTFRDMQDQKTVAAMAEHTPLGIGKAMTDFLSSKLAPNIAVTESDRLPGKEQGVSDARAS